MKLPSWLTSLGAEKKKDGAVVTYTVPVEKVENRIKKIWRKIFK